MLTLPSWLSLAVRPLDRVRPSFNQSGHGPRRRLLQPFPLHPPLLLLPRVVWFSRSSSLNLSALMLALTLLVMSCVRWTLVWLCHTTTGCHGWFHHISISTGFKGWGKWWWHRWWWWRGGGWGWGWAILMTMRWLLHSDFPFIICDKKWE